MLLQFVWATAPLPRPRNRCRFRGRRSFSSHAQEELQDEPFFFFFRDRPSCDRSVPKPLEMLGFDGAAHRSEQARERSCASNRLAAAARDAEDIIRGLCRDGKLDEALDMLSRLHSPPHGHAGSSTYMALLRACNRRKSVSHAKRLLSLIQMQQGHASSSSSSSSSSLLSGLVGDYLVVTLANCSALEDAWKVCCMLVRRTVFSWTAMVSAYVACGRAEEALGMRKHMRLDGVEPNGYTFVSLIKACGISQDLRQGRELHEEIRRQGLASDVFIGSTLVSMYGKCGAVDEAESVFASLCQRNIVSWNAMLAAYIERGEGGKALSLFRQMRDDGVGMDRHTLLFSLQACIALAGDLKSIATATAECRHVILELAHALHADAKRSGFSSDVFVGSTLVSIYGKLGAISEAVHVFCALPQRNVVSWTALVSAFVEANREERALQAYRLMQAEAVDPDKLSFVAALQACCSLAEKREGFAVGRGSNKGVALEIGQALRDDARTKKSFSRDAFLDCSLLTMYSKCGAAAEAERMFGASSRRSVALWNAMLALCVERGEGEKALQLFVRMREESSDLDEQTTVCALRAVCILAGNEEALAVAGKSPIKSVSLEVGRALHADARGRGVASDVFVCNTLVSMYGKCGAIAEAEHVFAGMSHHTVISWTALISAYQELGQGEEALRLYAQMRGEAVDADRLTYTTVLQACGVLAETEGSTTPSVDASCKSIASEIGRCLHGEVKATGIASDAFVGTALLSMYGKCGALAEAEKVFEAMLARPDVVAWSAMLSAYVDERDGQRALQAYRQMREEELPIDQLAAIIALQACSIIAEDEETPASSRRRSALEIGRALHADARRRGFASDLCVTNTILNMYGKCGALPEAEHVFASASERNTVSWNAMITACAEQGEEENALRLYEAMRDRGVGCDEVTLISVLKACCGSTGSSDICDRVHFGIVCAGYESIPSLSASVIHAYGSGARMADADASFDRLIEPRLAAWNACITGHAAGGNGAKSLRMFEKSKLEAAKPDGVTFTSAVSACARAGFVCEGLHYFASMSRDHGLLPQVKHYGALLDLLARSGSFERVEDLLTKMSVRPDQVIWLCLLGACHTHRNEELARHAFDRAVSIEPKHAAAYVMMSNIMGRGKHAD